MIKFEKTEVYGFGPAIRGMRNPKNSWDKSDSGFCKGRSSRCDTCEYDPGDYGPCYLATECMDKLYVVGPNDLDLMQRLKNAGGDHRKYLRMIVVYVDIIAPLYWWKEFDTYKIGTVSNSCSTMHKIHEKEFTLDDFSHERLNRYGGLASLKNTIAEMNKWRNIYNNGGTVHVEGEGFITFEPKSKEAWWQIIQLLPTSYNQRRTVMMNYEVLNNAYKARRGHKLDEWSEKIIEVDGEKHAIIWLNDDEMYPSFCNWVKTLPYAKELIIGNLVNGSEEDSN